VEEEDLYLLQQFGPNLDKEIGEQDIRDFLIAELLKIRMKEGGSGELKLNRAQREYSRRCTKKNIVLKARQMGITTYVAARFFLQTITRPGILAVQVAQSQETAESIFKIVRRVWENLPEGLRNGALIY
jgi:hypothetical protein